MKQYKRYFCVTERKTTKKEYGIVQTNIPTAKKKTLIKIKRVYSIKMLTKENQYIVRGKT
jgi:hypothetical protein